MANGGLRPDDLPAIGSAALAFPAMLEANGSMVGQVNGARLREAVDAMCDRLDGTDWQPVSTDDTWRSHGRWSPGTGRREPSRSPWNVPTT